MDCERFCYYRFFVYLFVIFFCHNLFEYQLRNGSFFIRPVLSLPQWRWGMLWCGYSATLMWEIGLMSESKICSREASGWKHSTFSGFIWLQVILLMCLGFCYYMYLYQIVLSLKQMKINGHKGKKRFTSILMQSDQSCTAHMDMSLKSWILHFNKI